MSDMMHEACSSAPGHQRDRMGYRGPNRSWRHNTMAVGDPGFVTVSQQTFRTSLSC